MTNGDCFREPDIVGAVQTGEWPGRVEPALRDHVRTCPVCAEVLAVALALREDAGEAGPVPLPTAAHVWWRAQIRARQDAARAIERPMSIVEGVAAASGVGLAAAAITFGWSAVSSGLHDVGALPFGLAIGGGVAVLVGLPVVLYFALSEK